MRKIDESKRPFFETHGEKGTTYFVHGYGKGIEKKIYFGEFNSLKEARQFIYRYVHRNPEWFNGNGDVNEYNNKQSRPDTDGAWHENVFKNEYPKQYKDFEGWNK
ncbi:hypothetical protein VSY18_27940 (plasmid) [Bacillus albus]|uniref:hypothetical protein n=1 Tax=Bacillus cereus group TaxID=86661 RepID=UPI0022E66E43|nr:MULTISPECIES: hypothetical protein [Bacillus cereus group]MDA2029857.1 hypothetical protein [Bacillus cereus group sp. Bcc03]MDA2219770.1 hypothetical protein [Bacillus cereus group sp. Bc228]MDA2231316.1 hypothetical protein [Bacillus cereus group sp. Bc227]MDA2264106.1 hypothetical protein [Bacillus cereus group sp. Bc200]MDA2324012.1 hypothetical protein [Bacillus cereus group sp. Bc177]